MIPAPHQQIARLRHRRGHTRVQLAELTGVGATTIKYLEKALSSATEDTLVALAEGMDADWVLVPRKRR